MHPGIFPLSELPRVAPIHSAKVMFVQEGGKMEAEATFGAQTSLYNLTGSFCLSPNNT